MFRIALWCGADGPPPWVREMVHHLRAASGVELVGCWRAATASPVPRDIALRLDHALQGWLSASTSPDPVAVVPRLDGVPAEGIDVILALTALPIPAPLALASRLGLWRLWAAGRALDDQWAGFEAIRDGAETIVLSLVAETASGRACLKRAVVDLSPYSLARTRAWLSARAAGLLLAALAAPEPGLPLPPRLGPDAPPHGRWQGWAAMAGRTLCRAVHKKLLPDQWLLAYRFGDPDGGLAGDDYRLIVPPRDRFWADPWVVEREGRHWVFCEEYLYATGRGRIVVLAVPEDGAVGPPTVVLERPYHLSYPCLFEWQDELYLLPETTAAGRLALYRCLDFPGRWEEAGVIMEGVALHDPTVWEADGCWWLAGVVACAPAPPHEALHLYHAATPLGPWQPHGGNPVVLDVRSARPAGPLLRPMAGGLWRPAQECTRYGRAVVVNQLLTATPVAYAERPLYRLYPQPGMGWHGLHTLARVGRLTVIDVLRNRPWSPLVRPPRTLRVMADPASPHTGP